MSALLHASLTRVPLRILVEFPSLLILSASPQLSHRRRDNLPFVAPL